MRCQGFKAIEAVNKFQWQLKELLNRFRVSFESTEDVKKIYGIKHALNTIEQVEPVKQQRLVPQCKNCQLFGHTKNYCNKQPRWVKIAGKHSMLKSNRKISQPKCFNCYDPQPATYWGCIVAKELQNLWNNLKSLLLPSGEMYENFKLNRLTGSNDQQANKSRGPQNLSVLNNPFKRTGQRNKVNQHLSINNASTSNGPLSQILSTLSRQEEFFKIIEYRSNVLEKVTQQDWNLNEVQNYAMEF